MNALVNQTFNAPISGVFSGVDAGDDLSGGITGGYGMVRYRGKVWAIHYRQQELQLMRPDGDGPKGSVEVVILKANPHLSKTWYENGWDETSTNPPDCASANGVVPDAGVPKKQSPTCLNCPRNQWNTALNGGKGKACGDHRRLAIVPLTDISNESFGGPMLLRCPAASLQDLAAFDSKYKQQGYPYFAIGVKIAFDPKESYPKFVFEPIRPLTDDEARLVVQMRASDAVARVISEGGAGAATAPEAAPQAAGFLEAPAGAPVSQVVAQRVSPQPAPVAAAPAPVAQPTPAAQPVSVAGPTPAPAPTGQTAGGFGAAASATVTAPAVQPAPTQPKATVMTGFGAVPATPAGNQVPSPAREATVAVQQAPANAPTNVVADAAFDASLDAKLAALIG